MDRPGRRGWVVRGLVIAGACAALTIAVVQMEHRRPILELERVGATIVQEADGRARTISFCSAEASDRHLRLMAELTSV
jgi:hypothetical protein